MIIPDLPIEEAEEMRERANRAGVHLVPLVAPTSNARIERIVTGARDLSIVYHPLG